MSEQTVNQEVPRCFNTKHVAMFVLAALIVGMLLGWVLGVANTPNQKDEVTKLQSEVISLKSEADKVSGLEKKIISADASIKQARAEGFDSGKSSCPATAPVASTPVVAPAPACPVVAHTHAPARKVVARSAPVVRQHFDNTLSVVVPATPAITTIYVGSGGGRCDWTNPITKQNVVARGGSSDECMQTLKMEANKQGFSLFIPVNKS